MMNKKKGTTYIELLIYIAVLTVFISGTIMYTLISQKQRLYNNAISEINYNANFINLRLYNEISNASNFSISADNSELILNYDLSEDSFRDPTVINVQNGKLMIGVGDSGSSCITTAMCTLSTNLVEINSITFENLTIPGGLPTIRYVFDIVYVGNSLVKGDNISKKTVANTVVIKSRL